MELQLLTTAGEINGKIQNIIKSTPKEKELFIVSPYIQLEKNDKDEINSWENIKKALRFAITNRNAEITFILRRPKKEEDCEEIIKILKEYKVEKAKIYFVNDLHAKLYMNDMEALVTSMNFYFHSTIRNQELGVLLTTKDNSQEIDELRQFIAYLIEEESPYQTESEMKDVQQESEKEIQKGKKYVEFLVKSIGYKWITVKTSDGYEEKIALDHRAKLELGKKYRVQAKKIWKRSKYAMTGILTELENLEMVDGVHQEKNNSGTTVETLIVAKTNPKTDSTPKMPKNGTCIRCGIQLDFNIKRPYCEKCYHSWNKYQNPDYEEKHCHMCGVSCATTFAHPICTECTNSLKN